MIERALPFDHVPMVGRGVRAKRFCGTRFEIGDDGVHRNAAAGDHDTGLAGRPKIDVESALREGARQRQRRIFLAQRAIGADGQQSHPAALSAGSNAQIRGRNANVDQPTARSRSSCSQDRKITEPGMHSANDVEARIE